MTRLRTALRTMPAGRPTQHLHRVLRDATARVERVRGRWTAKGTATLGFVAPFIAACAAWEGSRLRGARLWQAPSVRSWAAIAFWSLLPIVLTGLLGVLVAITVALVRSSAGLPDLRFIALTVLDLAAYTVAGFAAGLLMPFAVAGPLTIAVPFIWLGFVSAIDPPWLRHLTGMLRDCCLLPSDLAWRAVLASAIVNVGSFAPPRC